MDLAVIGINHKTAPVEIREKLSFPAGKAIEARPAPISFAADGSITSLPWKTMLLS